jgi:hypothetical protein
MALPAAGDAGGLLLLLLIFHERGVGGGRLSVLFLLNSEIKEDNLLRPLLMGVVVEENVLDAAGDFGTLDAAGDFGILDAAGDFGVLDAAGDFGALDAAEGVRGDLGENKFKLARRERKLFLLGVDGVDAVLGVMGGKPLLLVVLERRGLLVATAAGGVAAAALTGVVVVVAMVGLGDKVVLLLVVPLVFFGPV